MIGRAEPTTPSTVGARRPSTSCRSSIWTTIFFGVRIVRADHQQQVAIHDCVIYGLGVDHADAAHPVWVVVRHDVLTLHRMDQWRLRSIRESAQLFASAVASGLAHGYDAGCAVDPAGYFSDTLSSPAANSVRGFRVAAPEAPPSAFAPITSCGSVRWATPRST